MYKVLCFTRAPAKAGGGLAAMVAAAAVLAFQPAGSVSAAEVSSGSDKVTLSLSGQVNRGVLYADDGDRTNFLHVDNDNSSTRIRFIGSGKLNDQVTVGTQIEVQHESDSTANINIDGSTTGGDNAFTERKLELFFDHAGLGRLWLGQGDTASNGTSEVDLSGTGVIGYSGVTDMAGGIDFGGYDQVLDAPNVADANIGTVFSNFDGLSRDDRIRYDTPNFGGFKLSASSAQDSKHDVALRYSGGGAGLKIAGAVAYAVNVGDFDSQVNGSVSLLHSSGINLTLAGGSRDLGTGATQDPVFYYAKLGYIIGNTAIAIDFEQADDVEFQDDEATTVGLFLVKTLDAVGADLYAGARSYSLDRTANPNLDDIVAVLVGARVKF